MIYQSFGVYIAKYGDKTPGLENHHGVMDMWEQKNIPGYKPRPADSTAIALTKEHHNATRSVYGKWNDENYGFKGKVDWENVSPRKTQEISEKMFDTAKVRKTLELNIIENLINIYMD